ncbi:MAG: helix-hairpin-helix domain-containing protein [Armatimonadota bacterium]
MFNFTRHQLVAACVIVGMAIAGMAVTMVKSAFRGGEIRFVEQNPVAAASALPKPAKIVVHVAGKVKNPGVYELSAGSRVNDAVTAAGGALPDSDLDNVNLAARITDGEQIFIAPGAESPPPVQSVVRTGHEQVEVHPAKLMVSGKGSVNINTASLEELQRLPGIGEAMAQRIIDYRKGAGRFSTVDELDEVPGLGPKKIEKLRPFVSL